jgi:hypothetical protein
MTASASVTVQAGPSNTVAVPFNSQAVATTAQNAIDALNVISSMGYVTTFSVPNTPGTVNVPAPNSLGAVVDTVPASVNVGIMDARNLLLVNAGTGLLTAIGGPNTTVVSGANGSVQFTNNSSAGAVFLGGGNNWVGNWADGNRMVVDVDGAPTLFGASTVVDASKGASTVNVFNNGLIQVTSGAGATGSVNVQMQVGTGGVFVGGSSTVAATVTGTAGSLTYYGGNGTAGSAGAFINPGAGNVAIFPGMTGSATLFGGARSWGTAAEFTGAATVLGGTGYFEGGQHGYNVLQTSAVTGAATLIGGGDHDFLDVAGSGDFVHTGNGQGVIVYTEASVHGGNLYLTGNGSGTILGGQSGHNNFMLGSGNYTIAGFHDLSQGAVDGIGSIYQDLAGPYGGHGNITILDFVPQVVNEHGSVTFDKFLLNNLTASIDNSSGHSVATLSDGTTVTFQNAVVQNHGSFLA